LGLIFPGQLQYKRRAVLHLLCSSVRFWEKYSQLYSIKTHYYICFIRAVLHLLYPSFRWGRWVIVGWCNGSR